VKLVHPIREEVRWKIEYPSGSLVSPLDGDELLVARHDGKVERVDALTGRQTPLTSIPAGAVNFARTEAFALTDHHQIYLVMNSHDHPDRRHFGESLQSIQAYGKIFAWKKLDGSLAWQSEVEHHNLILDRFRTLPVMLFVSRSWKQKGSANYSTLSLKVIDKETGKTLHQSTTPSIYSGFNGVRVSYSNPHIELTSYNMKIRLSAYDGPLPVPTLETDSEDDE